MCCIDLLVNWVNFVFTTSLGVIYCQHEVAEPINLSGANSSSKPVGSPSEVQLQHNTLLICLYIYIIEKKMNVRHLYLQQIITLLPVLLVIGEGRTIHITPSAADISQCGNSCMTLTQFADSSQNTSRSDSNLTLIFLTGHHFLNTSKFDVTGILYVSMISLNRSTGDLKSTIHCIVSSNFHFKHNKQVEISGLNFNGCLENEVHNVSDFQMEDSLLIGARNLIGRALLVRNSTLHLKMIYFESFQGSCRPNTGGAIYCFQSIVSITDCTFINNTATSGGALYAEGNSEVTIENSKFSSHNAWFKGHYHKTATIVNSSAAFHSSSISQCSTIDGKHFKLKGGVISVIESNVNVRSSTFIDNIASYGGAVYCHKGAVVSISISNFTFNTATVYGGVIYQLDCNVKISRSNLNNNGAKLGGVIYHNATLKTNVLSLEDSYLYSNEAERGGVAYVSKSNVYIRRGQFSYNEARKHGGVLFLTSNTIATITSSNFSDNRAKSIGGALRAMNGSRVSILKSALFENNSAFYGAAIHLYRANIMKLIGNISITNNNASLGCVSIINSNLQLDGKVSFTENVGSLFAYGGEILMKGIVNFTGHSIRTHRNKNSTVVKREGGCISLLLSMLNISRGNLSLSHSRAINGGGLLVITSTLKILDGKLHIINNTASNTGGGIYLYQSRLYIRGTVDISNNSAFNSGGGIHAISAVILVHIQKLNFVKYSKLYLTSNSAHKGGGICLEVNSQLYLTQLLESSGHSGSEEIGRPVRLHKNRADYGGAIYVADGTNLGTCSSDRFNLQTITAASYSECFFQLISIANEAYKFKDAFEFSNNIAYTSGSLLFGGLLDRCTVSSLTKHHKKYSNVAGFAEGIVNDTSSHPVKVCSCSANGNRNGTCTSEESKKTVKKGETFSLYVVAIDQMNHTTNATIHSYLSSNGTIIEGQRKHAIGNTCTELSFTVYSLANEETLTLFADGPCKDLGISPLKVAIHLSPCDCPAGFELNKKYVRECKCVCHTKLLSVPFMKEMKCNSTTLKITRNKPFWISFENGKFIVYDECPSDYCVPSLPPVNISLNSSDGADVQCNYNRSGKLCGQCQQGLTLSLGSSRCMECPHYWPANLIAVIIGALLTGVVLVGLLLVTNLTVAAGTLNGVIFYANVLSTNKDLFMPFQNPNFHSVFIAWLNLDLGFDVCFVKGMDTYDKTWLQIAFPVYLILVVITIMIASKYSVRFSRVISPKNPVATLATLILLSYTKLLDNSIIATLYASLSYIPESEDDEYVEVVWAYDASVPYLKGKHILLFIVAIFIFLIGFVYTFLLLFWQWLVYLPNNSLFKWVRNTKLSSFIDAYHAPFSARNRYWTGLLLLARVILHVTAAIFGTPSVNLLSISLIVGCILLLQGYSGVHIYKRWPLNILEFTSYFNILAFTVCKFYVLLTEDSGTAIAYVSISVEFVIFLCVIIYHVSIETNVVHRIKHSGLCKIQFSQCLHHPLLSKERHELVSNSSGGITFSEVMLDNETDRTMKEREDTTKLFSEEL